jgi:hypothetical protein
MFRRSVPCEVTGPGLRRIESVDADVRRPKSQFSPVDDMSLIKFHSISKSQTDSRYSNDQFLLNYKMPEQKK